MSKMKNFMDFKTFSVSESYYNDFSYFGKDRSTELGRKLERIRGRVKAEAPNQKLYGDMIVSKLVSGLLGLGAAASDALGRSGEGKKEKRDKKEETEKAFSEWSENLGPTTTEKDLEKFAKKSEEAAFKRYGKSWDYNNPKGSDQKKFADAIKKGESEIASRMKK